MSDKYPVDDPWVYIERIFIAVGPQRLWIGASGLKPTDRILIDEREIAP